MISLGRKHPDHMHKFWILMGLLVSSTSLFSQKNQLALTDLQDFNTAGTNWQIVGDVTMLPVVPQLPPTGKKKKRQPSAQVLEPITTQAGSGVLVNLPDDNNKAHLVTNWTHGDLLLELEVMLPPASNSGIYLQGRYEVQLFDSWGVQTPSFSDMGGIYRNWETAPDKSYMGKAPLVNAAKAPGLWQHLRIHFEAPRFDVQGAKVANARLVSVYLNNALIHQDVELPLPTGGSLAAGEVAEGPLMIQGDHGAVAFRNIRYTQMKPIGITLTDLKYTVAEGRYETPEELQQAKPVRSGSSPILTWEAAGTDNLFGLKYTGKLNVATSGTYEFTASVGGNVALLLDGERLFFETYEGQGTLQLSAGVHDLELIYTKYYGWQDPMLALTVSLEWGTPLQLHSLSSYPPGRSLVSPILMEPGAQPRVLRAFLDFEGDEDQRLTHVMAVGDPTGVHYAFDMGNGTLAAVWKGGFANATPMWHDRGDGSFRPAGSPVYLSNSPSLNTDAEIVSSGYTLDPKTGRPTFRYRSQGLEVAETTSPFDGAKGVVREVIVSGQGSTHYLLAMGQIRRLPNGYYHVMDKGFYVRILSGTSPSLESYELETGTEQSLSVPVAGNTSFTYAIIW